MSAPQFTPAPWQTSGHAEGCEFEVLDANGGYIAGVAFEPDNGRMHAAARADARLIAAAPCMALYIKKQADAGDVEAAELWERINANS